jgi:AcrR family transcriptional regulator
MAVKRARGKRPYHHGDLRAALLAAVAPVVGDHGVGHVSVRAVARRLGVTHAAAAHHFGNKTGLLTAFATQGYALLAESVATAITEAAPKNGPDTLEAVGRGYVRFALRHREHFEVMFRLDILEPQQPEFVAASELAYGLLVSTVARCAAEGFLGGLDPELVAVSAWSIVHGLSALWISGRLSERIEETDPDRLAARVSRLYVDRILRQGSRGMRDE